ncbi:MAG: hypothetical protein OSB60_15845, partial [Myxococcota bacterium]|nr:hypothetical protein [Myxococcota bacterium]
MSETSHDNKAPLSNDQAALNDRISRLFERMSDGLDLVNRAMREQLESASDIMPVIGSHVLSSG